MKLYSKWQLLGTSICVITMTCASIAFASERPAPSDLPPPPPPAQEIVANGKGMPPHGMKHHHPCPFMQQQMAKDGDKPPHWKEDKKFPFAPEHMGKKLNLTEEQKAKAEAIHKKGIEELKPLFAKMKELQEEANKLRIANMEEFENILTDEQKAILKDMKEKGKRKFKEWKHRHHDKDKRIKDKGKHKLPEQNKEKAAIPENKD